MFGVCVSVEGVGIIKCCFFKQYIYVKQADRETVGGWVGR